MRTVYRRAACGQESYWNIAHVQVDQAQHVAAWEGERRERVSHDYRAVGRWCSALGGEGGEVEDCCWARAAVRVFGERVGEGGKDWRVEGWFRLVSPGFAGKLASAHERWVRRTGRRKRLVSMQDCCSHTAARKKRRHSVLARGACALSLRSPTVKSRLRSDYATVKNS